jgi:glutamate-ammonia-ligase adenylyltransferase
MATTQSQQPAPLSGSLAALADERVEALRSALGRPASKLPGDARRVLACSDFVFRTLTRDPEVAFDLFSSGDLDRTYPQVGADPDARPSSFAYFRELAAHALAGIEDETVLGRAMRRLRQREMLRVAWRDIGALAQLEETLRDTSALADAIVEACTDWLHERLAAEAGVPTSADGEAQRLTVLGLGKLGACELNFSSDIDLIFTFARPGQTEGGRRNLDNEEYFARLGQRLIKALDELTEDGRVYRVDMRLRPFGTSGPLAMSFDAMEQYYQLHGRDWERYAMVRARVVAGDVTGGAKLVERLRPFVYRRYLDFGALGSMREMKRLITEEVARKGLTDNVKLGAGGIREVEFTGQAFQMVRGGRLPDLRGRRITAVLERIGTRELLPAHAVRHLVDAYRFLRTVEHRLQQVEDRQTHTLPSDDAGRARLAAGLGYPDWDTLSHDIVRHRMRVSAQFDQVFGAPTSEDGEEDRLAVVWQPETEAETGSQLLAQAGFEDPQGAWEAVDAARGSNALRLMDNHGRERLTRVLPDLLRACAAQPNGVQTIRRALDIVETVARRSAYLALLAERPLALSQLVKLCSASPWIARQIARHPLLLDELLDSRTLYEPLPRTALEADLDARFAAVTPGDTEQEMEVLRQFKQASVLKVAAADVAHAMPLMVVSDHLTEIAETTLRKTLSLVWRDLVARYGEPRATVAGQRSTVPFAIAAYGKLGGIELGYGSDLDIVFVHGSAGDEQHTDGPKVVDNAIFFARLAQRLIHFLSTQTTEGVLYEVDSRLRPDGSAGLIVNGIEAVCRYLLEKAWTWEHQALVRARVVAGDAGLAARFAEIRREVMLAPRNPDELRESVRSMRERMRQALGSGARTGFDLKQDPGGIADIEFMVQYGALRWAEKLGDSLRYTDNIRLLEGFARAGLMPEEDSRFLMDAYRAYRARVHELALQEREIIEDETEFHTEREGVLCLWRRLMEDAGQTP